MLHSFSSDRLLRQIIEVAVDEQYGSISLEQRHRCIERVCDDVGNELAQQYSVGDVSPTFLAQRIREEVVKAMEAGEAAA